MARNGADVEMQLTDRSQHSSPRQGEQQQAQPTGLLGVLRSYLVLEWFTIIAVVILGAALEVPRKSADVNLALMILLAKAAAVAATYLQMPASVPSPSPHRPRFPVASPSSTAAIRAT